jgi:hypothetical protein
VTNEKVYNRLWRHPVYPACPAEEVLVAVAEAESGDIIIYFNFSLSCIKSE